MNLYNEAKLWNGAFVFTERIFSLPRNVDAYLATIIFSFMQFLETFLMETICILTPFKSPEEDIFYTCVSESDLWSVISSQRSSLNACLVKLLKNYLKCG